MNITKDKKELSIWELINLVKKNDIDALEILHAKFRPLILKYSNLYNLSVDEIKSEFNMIIFKIALLNIIADEKILKYIKVSMIHLEKLTNIDSKDLKDLVKNVELETNLFFEDIIKDINGVTQQMIRMRYLEGLTVENIAQEFQISKQAVSQRINRELKKIRKCMENDINKY